MLEPRRLFLMRHARPQPSGAGPDLARELSPEGWAQARRVGANLRGKDAPSVIFSSPATRCQQTAAGVVEGLGDEVLPEIIVRAELGLDDPSACLEELVSAASNSLIVSHQPTLMSLAAAILVAPSPPVDLRPAQVALLESNAGTWRLRRLFDPPRP